MSKQDVKKYFEMLLTNDEFTKKIIETGEDKEAKMKVVREHGLNFSKDEFLEYQDECKRVCDDSGIDLKKLNQEINEHLMEGVVGGGIVSTPFCVGATVLMGLLGCGMGAYTGLVADLSNKTGDDSQKKILEVCAGLGAATTVFAGANTIIYGDVLTPLSLFSPV